jgi:hypothetical protein
MDSLEIEGKEYISAKRAAKENSYTTDYIGQLIRGGKLKGHKVGRAWYVEQDSLSLYINSLVKTSESKSFATPVLTATPKESNNTEESIVNESKHQIASTETNSPLAKETPPHKEEAVRAYHYEMLNYVKENESKDLIPELNTKGERRIDIHKEYEPEPTHSVSSRYQSEPHSYSEHVEPEEEIRSDIRPSPRTYKELQFGDTLGPQVSYLPAKRRSLLPVAIGATIFVLLAGVVGISTLFTKTINYEGSTSSVTEGVNYDNLLVHSK